MSEIYLYTLGSVLVVSLISLVGIISIGWSDSFLRKVLHYLIGFSAGALLGDVFLHIIPEMSETGFTPRVGVYFLIGIIVFFLLEKYILWHYGHDHHGEEVHTTNYLVTFGDALHNFIDGIVIAASFLVDVQLGIATTIAVLFHEIPQEIGQFALLIHGGWSKGKALLYNFASALTSILGAMVVLIFAPGLKEAPTILLAFAAASFIYIAMSDIIPELHKERSFKKSILQIISVLLGILIMVLLLSFE